MNERRVPAWRPNFPADETQEPKSFQETKSPEEKEELIMKYVLVLQRKWEESNNETASDT